MKNLIISIAVLFIITGLASCGGPGTGGYFKTPPTQYLEILVDNTDQLVRPASNDIIALYNFNNTDLYTGYYLRVQRLSAFNLTPITELSVPAQSKLEGNDMKRSRLIKVFRKNVRDLIDSINREKIIPQKNSVLYRSITQQLNHLGSLDSNSTKICLIFSDLMESSTDANYYGSDFVKVKTNPQAMIDRLQKIEPLRDLHNIRIVVVFKPQSYAQELQFDPVYAMYKKTWEAKGASVSLSASSNLISQ